LPRCPARRAAPRGRGALRAPARSPPPPRPRGPPWPAPRAGRRSPRARRAPRGDPDPPACDPRSLARFRQVGPGPATAARAHLHVLDDVVLHVDAHLRGGDPPRLDGGDPSHALARLGHAPTPAVHETAAP